MPWGFTQTWYFTQPEAVDAARVVQQRHSLVDWSVDTHYNSGGNSGGMFTWSLTREGIALTQEGEGFRCTQNNGLYQDGEGPTPQEAIENMVAIPATRAPLQRTGPFYKTAEDALAHGNEIRRSVANGTSFWLPEPEVRQFPEGFEWRMESSDHTWVLVGDGEIVEVVLLLLKDCQADLSTRAHPNHVVAAFHGLLRDYAALVEAQFRDLQTVARDFRDQSLAVGYTADIHDVLRRVLDPITESECETPPTGARTLWEQLQPHENEDTV